MDADKTKMLFLSWLAAKNKKPFPICAGAQNENLHHRDKHFFFSLEFLPILFFKGWHGYW